MIRLLFCAFCAFVASVTDHSIHERVDRLTVFDDALSQASFKFISCLFEHARGSSIPIEYVRIQATQIAIRKRVITQGKQRFSRASSSPKPLAQPITNLSGATAHVVLRYEAYTTHCLARYINRKISFRFVIDHAVEPVARIADRVRIRKTIAQVDRHLPVVCVTHNRIAITPLPASYAACLQNYFHCASIRGNTAAPRGITNPSPLPA